jgi:hypothetical protein
VSDAKEEVGKAILISLSAIWLWAIAAYLIIRPQFDAHVRGVENEFGPYAPISMFTLRPADAFMVGGFLTAPFLIHWWISGLFGREGMSKMPIANGMLVGAVLCGALELFDRGAQDFHGYSLFCRQGEPISVVFLDEVYQCERSRLARSTIGAMIFLLPILAIPVRMVESRLRLRKA